MFLGELSGDGCKAVCEVLLHPPMSYVTLNIHGKLTDQILRCTARCVKEEEKLSSPTIKAWVEMAEKEKKFIIGQKSVSFFKYVWNQCTLRGIK